MNSCAVAKMQPFIPVAVFLLGIILGNGGKLVAASVDYELDDEEHHLSSVVDAVEGLYQLFHFEHLIADPSENVKPFSYTQDKLYDYPPLPKALQTPEQMHQYYIIHGWKGNMFDEWINDTSEAIRKHKENMVFRIDWSIAAALGYIEASNAVKTIVGKQVGKYIVEEFKKGKLDLDKLTIIGHGLGAHIAGIASKKVFDVLGKKVGKVIGASPAGPFFHIASGSKKLQKDDAKCVVVLHTDRLLFGYKLPIGGMDFYANGGTRQPGCNSLLSACSHERAALYLAEGFAKVPGEIKSLEADGGLSTFIQALAGNCSTGNGEYHFDTNSEPPFLLDE